MTSFYGTNHGDFFWHELTSPDPASSAPFYKAVLGWDLEPRDMGGFTYQMIRRAGQDMGGAMPMEGPMWDGIAPHWMLYVAVDDADKAKADVEANGGTVKVGPFDAPGVGRMLVVADPKGAVFTLIQPAPEM